VNYGVSVSIVEPPDSEESYHNRAVGSAAAVVHREGITNSVCRRQKHKSLYTTAPVQSRFHPIIRSHKPSLVSHTEKSSSPSEQNERYSSPPRKGPQGHRPEGATSLFHLPHGRCGISHQPCVLGPTIGPDCWNVSCSSWMIYLY